MAEANMSESFCQGDFKFRINLFDIFKFAESNSDSRNMTGGEDVLNAKHIIACGTNGVTEKQIRILALCFQTSAMNSSPHTVKISFEIQEGNLLIAEAECSCKAGSGKCKHVVAVLLYCNRNDVTALESFSCTDLKCLWSERKGTSLAQYAPVPLNQFCHVKWNSLKLLDHEKLLDFKSRLEKAAPMSALNKHKLGRKSTEEIAPDQPEPTSVENTDVPNDSRPEKGIVERGNTSLILIKLKETLDPTALPDHCQRSFSSLGLTLEESVAISIKTQDDKEEWKKQRQFRITGSRCYALFTYGSGKNVNWPNKMEKYIWPGTFSNSNMLHGIKYEPIAKTVYAAKLDCTVLDCGIVIPNNCPFLGYSPDGIVVGNNGHVKLLEIKCPVSGAKMTASEVVAHCKYLAVQGDQVSLKPKHSYYGQVQLGMAILNLESCDFVVFSSFDSTMTVVSVPYNQGFAWKLLCKLRDVFFGHMIHYICSGKPE